MSRASRSTPPPMQTRATLGRSAAGWLLVAPLIALAVSFVQAPYLTSVRGVAGTLPLLPTSPYPLYRSGRTAFFYTSADLLAPQAFGPPGRFIESVAFDVWPAGEGTTDPIESLTWFTRSWESIAGGPQPTSTSDVDLADRFRASVGGAPRLQRGEAASFDLPSASGYRSRSGLRRIVVLATRPSRDPQPVSHGTPQLFHEALQRALDDLRKAGIRSIGIPRMAVTAEVGQETSRGASWEVILDEADVQAPGLGMTTVLFGGWGLDPRSREANDSAFRAVWEKRRPIMADRARRLTHEQWRLASVIALAALLQWRLRGSSVGWLRVLALAIVTAGLALTIAQGAHWIASTLHLTPLALFATELVVALAAGSMIEQIVRFDPKAAVRGESTTSNAG